MERAVSAATPGPVTPAERQYLLHVLGFVECSDLDEVRAMAQRHAELDPYQLARLPDLLERSLQKRAERAA